MSLTREQFKVALKKPVRVRKVKPQVSECEAEFQRNVQEKINTDLVGMKAEIKAMVAEIVDGPPGANRTVYFLHDILTNIYFPAAVQAQMALRARIRRSMKEVSP